jgi:hypothetical protein
MIRSSSFQVSLWRVSSPEHQVPSMRLRSVEKSDDEEEPKISKVYFCPFVSGVRLLG